MNDDLDSMNDLDSILAEFGGSAPQEEAPAAPAAPRAQAPAYAPAAAGFTQVDDDELPF